MLIRYKGGRSRFEVNFNRQSYNFSIDNNRTIEISDQKVINYIFSLSNRHEFEPIEKVVPIVKAEPQVSLNEPESKKKPGRPKKEKKNG